MRLINPETKVHLSMVAPLLLRHLPSFVIPAGYLDKFIFSHHIRQGFYYRQLYFLSTKTHPQYYHANSSLLLFSALANRAPISFSNISAAAFAGLIITTLAASKLAGASI